MDAARSETSTDLTITEAGVSIGTPGYMAPEQVAGEQVDSRADIYAWGVVAWELLATRHPFAARTTRQAMLAAHLTEEAPAIDTHAKVPPAVAALVMSCLNKVPERRPQTASEILAVLDAAATPMPTATTASTASKRIAAVVAGLAVVAAVVFLVPRLRDRSAPADTTGALPSVAVLPFENIGGDTAQEYFADGMTDELATALGRLPGLRVAARSSAYRYKGRRDIDPREVGNELGVKYLLSGSVRRTGEQIRLSAQLVESSGAVEIWSDSYSRRASDVMALQDSLTMAITTALAERLGPAGSVTPTAASNRGTNSHEAYDLYLKGHYYLNRRRPGLEGAVRSFEGAIAVDPQFGRAYAGLANALALLTYFGEKPARAAASHRLRAARTGDRQQPRGCACRPGHHEHGRRTFCCRRTGPQVRYRDRAGQRRRTLPAWSLPVVHRTRRRGGHRIRASEEPRAVPGDHRHLARVRAHVLDARACTRRG